MSQKTGMVIINDNDYQAIASKLLDSIGGTRYFNGTVPYDTEGYSTVLRATLIVYREPELAPDDPTGKASRIRDVVPVWWEFHLYDDSGERITDFCWQELRGYLL